MYGLKMKVLFQWYTLIRLFSKYIMTYILYQYKFYRDGIIMYILF